MVALSRAVDGRERGDGGAALPMAEVVAVDGQDAVLDGYRLGVPEVRAVVTDSAGSAPAWVRRLVER